MTTSVLSVDSDLAGAAKQYGQLFNRSMDEQIKHWAEIGRAIEETPDFSIQQVAQVMCVLDPGDFPEHPHRRVAAMEAAVEVVGMRISELYAEVYQERRSKARDDRRIDALLKQISILRELQEDLTPEDTVRVKAILSGDIPGNG